MYSKFAILLSFCYQSDDLLGLFITKLGGSRSERMAAASEFGRNVIDDGAVRSERTVDVIVLFHEQQPLVNSDDVFEGEIRKQVLLAVEEADVILFVVDVMNGVTDLDMDVAAILRKSDKPIVLVANKTDNNEQRYYAAEFYKLGIGDPVCISAATGADRTAGAGGYGNPV